MDAIGRRVARRDVAYAPASAVNPVIYFMVVGHDSNDMLGSGIFTSGVNQR